MLASIANRAYETTIMLMKRTIEAIWTSFRAR